MSTEDRKTVAQELAVKGGQDWPTLSPEMVNAYLHNADLVIEERNRPPVDELNPKPLYTCDRCKDTAYIGGKRCGECNPMGLPVEQVHPKIVDEMPVVSISGGIPEGMEVGESITITSEVAIEVERVYSSPDKELELIDDQATVTLGEDTLLAGTEFPADTEEEKVEAEGRGLPEWGAMINDGGEEMKGTAARFAIEADEKAALEAEEVKRTRELKPTEYRCSKCSKPGKTIIHMLKKGGKGIGHKHQEFKGE